MLAKALSFTLLLTLIPSFSSASNSHERETAFSSSRGDGKAVYMVNSHVNDLNKEIERQEKMYWQEQVNLKFSQLKNHFSTHELKQMGESGEGIELTKLTPKQNSGLHNLLSATLTPLGYIRATSLLGLHSVHREMGKAGDVGSLLIRQPEGLQELVIKSSTFSITLMQESESWAVTSLYMGHWPRQVTEAPQPDLSLPEIHYPYTRWNESVGISPLGQTARLAIRVLNELPPALKKRACLGSSHSDINCPLESIDMEGLEGITLDDLTALGRHLMKMLVMQLQGHLEFTETSDLSGIRLSWAGEIPLLYHAGDNSDLVINLATEAGRWQIIMSGTRPSDVMEALPENALMIRFINSQEREISFPSPRGDGKDISMVNNAAADMAMDNLPQITPASQSSAISARDSMPDTNYMEEGLSENQITDTIQTGGDETENRMPGDDDGITWLKDPAFLSDLALSIGYQGDRISARTPFIPVVRAKKDGRIHKNIRVSITLQEEGRDPWLENLPLVYHPESGDYRTDVHLPASMSGEQLMIKFSIHEPGTRYEGLYDYTVKVGTGEVIPTSPHF